MDLPMRGELAMRSHQFDPVPDEQSGGQAVPHDFAVGATPANLGEPAASAGGQVVGPAPSILHGEHGTTWRRTLVTVPFALLASAIGAAVPHAPLLVRVPLAFVFGGAWLEAMWRFEMRHRLVWGPGGVAYRRDYREGSLRWEGLAVTREQGQAVGISGVVAAGATHDGQRAGLSISASAPLTPSWLRFWSHTAAELVRVLTAAQALALKSGGSTQLAPELARARRGAEPWVWALLTVVLLVIVSTRHS